MTDNSQLLRVDIFDDGTDITPDTMVFYVPTTIGQLSPHSSFVYDEDTDPSIYAKNWEKMTLSEFLAKEMGILLVPHEEDYSIGKSPTVEGPNRSLMTAFFHKR